MATDWEISRRTGKCSATDRELAEGEAYYAVLVETPEGFERRDYTLESWNGPPEGSFCHWRGRVPVRDKRRGAGAVSIELLTQLFLRLEDEEAQAKEEFRFMLALLLMRKRVLKFQASIQEGDVEYWQLMLMSDQSCQKVVNPRLSDERVDRLGAQLTAILGGEVDAIECLDQDDATEPRPDDAEGIANPEDAQASENDQPSGGVHEDMNDSDSVSPEPESSAEHEHGTSP